MAPEPQERRRLGIAEAYAAVAALAFVVARFAPVLSFDYPCPLRTVLGIPCATCGMTHAFVYLAHGEVARAFAWSPAGALLAAAVWLLVAADLVRLAAGWRLPSVPERWARRGVATGLAVLALNWGWLLWHGYGA
jgi:hypothetical protein